MLEGVQQLTGLGALFGYFKYTREQQPWPFERANHAACCLGFGSEYPHLLVIGGECGDWKGLKDCWLFDVSRRRWKEVRESTVCVHLCRYMQQHWTGPLGHTVPLNIGGRTLVHCREVVPID